jgi:hypothetical protein
VLPLFGQIGWLLFHLQFRHKLGELLLFAFVRKIQFAFQQASLDFLDLFLVLTSEQKNVFSDFLHCMACRRYFPEAYAVRTF